MVTLRCRTDGVWIFCNEREESELFAFLSDENILLRRVTAGRYVYNYQFAWQSDENAADFIRDLEW